MSKPELKLLPVIAYGDDPENLSGVQISNGQLFVDLRDGALKQAAINDEGDIVWTEFQAGEGVPGPAGQDGKDGEQGPAGQDGKDGEPWDPTTLPGYSETGTLELTVVDGVLQWVEVTAE